MRRISLRIVLMFILTGINGVVSADAYERGTIDPGWLLYTDGNVFFFLTPGTTTNPSCNAIPERWAFDTTTQVGRSFFSTFLSAYATGKEIRVSGDGSCTHGNTETVTVINVY